jgi:CheY-like chemotaxis protein
MVKDAPDWIMIVGGDAHFCYLMRRYLQRGSRFVSYNNTCENILTNINNSPPAAIIIELGQPENKVWQSIRELKLFPETRKIPIIVCSWHDDEEDARAAGADYHLRMPILFQDFHIALKTLGLVK